MTGAPGQRLRVLLTRAEGFRLEIDLHLPARGITVLFGPSGSGKTTLLRCVAGLERSGTATIEVAGECWQDTARGVFLPAWRRSIGYVFQEASLFEHLDVRGNLDFAADRARKRLAGAPARVPLQDAIALLGIDHLLARRPHELSGGERQRVAIARALAAQPRVMLLDEPLSALDMPRRREILPWLERMRDQLEIPMLYVTHSAEEMARLADTLVVMDQGRALACGPTAQVLLGVELDGLPAQDVGFILEGEVVEHDRPWHLMKVAFPGGSLWLPDSGCAQGHRVRVRLLARDVSVALEEPRGTSVQNLLPCTVCAMRTDPRQTGQVLVTLTCSQGQGESTLLARITARAADTLALAPGVRVWAQVKAAALVG